MVTPLVGAAAIGGVSSVVGGIFGGKGAKKAAKIQADNDAKNRAETARYYALAEQRYGGDIAQADRSRDIYAGLLGTGGNAAQAQAAYDTWRNSSNYKTVLNGALDATNANAYARGMGRSGAAAMALQDRGGEIASGYQQQYLSNLNAQIQTGANAKAALTGVGTNSVQLNAQSGSNAANAGSNAALYQGQYWSNAAQNLGRDFADTYSSSYKKGS